MAHLGQTLPDSNIPYINHLSNVAMEILNAIARGELVTQEQANLAMQCALLHDTIEDTDCSYQDILEHFGQSIADGVMALTKNPLLPTKQEQMLDSLKRIKQQPSSVGMVKLADRITNLQRPPANWDKQKAARYQQEAQLIHQYLQNTSPYLALRLQNKISRYSQYIE